MKAEDALRAQIALEGAEQTVAELCAEFPGDRDLARLQRDLRAQVERAEARHLDALIARAQARDSEFANA